MNKAIYIFLSIVTFLFIILLILLIANICYFKVDTSIWISIVFGITSLSIAISAGVMTFYYQNSAKLSREKQEFIKINRCFNWSLNQIIYYDAYFFSEENEIMNNENFEVVISQWQSKIVSIKNDWNHSFSNLIDNQEELKMIFLYDFFFDYEGSFIDSSNIKSEVKGHYIEFAFLKMCKISMNKNLEANTYYKRETRRIEMEKIEKDFWKRFFDNYDGKKIEGITIKKHE